MIGQHMYSDVLMQKTYITRSGYDSFFFDTVAPAHCAYQVRCYSLIWLQNYSLSKVVRPDTAMFIKLYVFSDDAPVL